MSPPTILIVDDSSSVRRILKAHLAGLQAEVLTAESGERALQLARLMPLSLIIADIMMPGMDGFQLVELIRKDSRESVARLPVILLTSDCSEAARVRMREVGADEMLDKADPGEVLLTAIGRHLGKMVT